jgi:hypothetical protein
MIPAIVWLTTIFQTTNLIDVEDIIFVVCYAVLFAIVVVYVWNVAHDDGVKLKERADKSKQQIDTEERIVLYHFSQFQMELDLPKRAGEYISLVDDFEWEQKHKNVLKNALGVMDKLQGMFELNQENNSLGLLSPFEWHHKSCKIPNRSFR